MCQEALANVRKHAQASTVRVRLCYAQDVLRLKGADDGCGFASERPSERPSERLSEGLSEAANGGYGLRGMRDRVQQVGGSVLVTSVPGAGTEIRSWREVPG